MFAFYAPDRVNLSQDDVEGVVGLYGRATETRQVQIVGSASGSLLRAADEASFEVRVPAELGIKLDGPDDSDFDLYVRKGAPPTTSEWDFRAYTVSSDEAIRFPAETGASYFVMVRSYSGDGDFTLRVEPGYRADLGLVVETAAGTHASCLIGWVDELNEIGLIEPVGTREAHRRQGLARALNLEALGRLRDAGMRYAQIGTTSFNDRAEAIYRSCGFEILDRDHFWFRHL